MKPETVAFVWRVLAIIFFGVGLFTDMECFIDGMVCMIAAYLNDILEKMER